MQQLLLGDELSVAKAWRVKRSSRHAGQPVLLLEGISTREAAQALTGQKIFAAEAMLASLRQPGELLWADVEGARVIDEQGVSLGTVAGIYQTPAHDVAEVVNSGQAVSIPLIPAFVDFAGSTPGKLRLSVAADCLADIWYPLRPKEP